MENFKNEYLKEKIEPEETSTAREQSDKAAELSNKELFEFTWNKNGVFEFEKGNTKFYFEYSTPKFSELFKLSLKQGILTIDGINILQKAFKQIDKIDIKNEAAHFNLSETLLEGYKVFFNPNSYAIGDSRVDLNEKIIFLKANPLTTHGLLALMHEVGHQQVIQFYETKPEPFHTDFNNYQKIVSDRRKMLGNKVLKGNNYNRENAGEIILKDERDAWSFALKNLRGFANDLDIDIKETENLIHGSCLQSYSEAIRDMIVKN